MSETVPNFCHLCLTETPECGRLIPLVWKEVSVAIDHTGTSQNGICESCIRQMKRLPFSEIRRAPPVPEVIEVPELDEPGDDPIF